jgi:nicotinate phosphoribosyltransferase
MSIFRFNQDKPIVNSLSDDDFYKFTMGQLAFKYHAGSWVTLSFACRTKDVDLTKLIDIGQLREELDHCMTLSFNKKEIHYLRGTNEYQERMFEEPYLQFLTKLRLPPYILEYANGKILLSMPGYWPESTHWEIHALTIINELYCRAILGKDKGAWDRNFAVGIAKLYEKIAMIKKYPELTFSDFGTRRRFSYEWQEYVVETCARELPGQFVGTSNVKLAMDLDTDAKGTTAHERDTVLAAENYNDDTAIRNSIWQNTNEWWNQYGFGLSIFLPDTFGTDAFFREFGSNRAAAWKGGRQDSGNPYDYGNKQINMYRGYEINHKEKMIVFSDGLTVPSAIDLHLYFHPLVIDTYGIGTNLTNDLLVPPISIVVKVTEVNGHPAVKLSDNLNKAMGDPAEVERYKKIFGYTRNFREECLV